MKLKCLFKGHEYFWETIYLNFDEKHRVWNKLFLRVCVRCGCVKAQVLGKDDNGCFAAGENHTRKRKVIKR